MTGLTWSAPDLRPRWWRRISGAPSNWPPTRPRLARNSSMIWAFQLAIVALLSSALDRTLTRAGRKPRPGLGDRRHRPVCRPPLLAPAYRVAMRFLRRNWAHSPLGTRRCSSRNAIATVLEGGRVEYFTPAHVLPTHRPRPVGAAWRFCCSSIPSVSRASTGTPPSARQQEYPKSTRGGAARDVPGSRCGSDDL